MKENWNDLEQYQGQKGQKCSLPHSRNRLVDTHPKISILILSMGYILVFIYGIIVGIFWGKIK